MSPEAVAKRELVHNNHVAVFIEQVKKVLDTGNIVSLLSYSEKGFKHYTTIKGIRGKNVKIMDSASGGERYTSVDNLLKSFSGKSIELTWFEKLKKPEEMKKEFTNLEYSREKGYSQKQVTQEALYNVSLRHGVCVGKVGQDLYPLTKGTTGIEWAAYIPKQPANV